MFCLMSIVWTLPNEKGTYMTFLRPKKIHSSRNMNSQSNSFSACLNVMCPLSMVRQKHGRRKAPPDPDIY